MRDRDLAKDDVVQSIETTVMKYMNKAKQHGLTDILPMTEHNHNNLPVLSIDLNKRPDIKQTAKLDQKIDVCTCPVKVEKTLSKKKQKKQRQRQTFFLGGSNNNGYIINCPIHGKRTDQNQIGF